MLFFAVFTNAAAGIGTGVYIIMHSFDWRIIFALWNIANSILMIIMLKAGLINISCINDRKMTLDRAVIGLIMMFIVFAICNFVFDFYWLITFSICIIYTTNFERSIQSIFFGRTDTLSE